MEIQLVNAQDPEKIYAAVKNASGAAMSAGAAAYMVVASGDGISVSNAGTTRKWGFAGILKDALATVGASSYGRAQVYGFCSAYMVLADSTVSATPGVQLNAVASQNYLRDTSTAALYTFVAVSSATFTWNGGNPFNYVTLMDTYASAASANTTPALKSVFVKAL
jgi:hypothetical protein